MGNIKFTIAESRIAELLGRQNFSTKESAVFEIVKNSFDSDSKKCDIYIDNNCMKITDFGVGMNEEDIMLNWMHVDKSNKGYKSKNSDRVLSGSKGVGRFALARLGDKVKVVSKKVNEVAVIWKTDWITSEIQDSTVEFYSGTSIEISDLRDRWNKKDIENLIQFLSRAYNNGDMEINVHFEGESHRVNSIFNDIKIGVNFTSKILLDYDSKNMMLSVLIKSDEFKPEVVEVIGSTLAKRYEETFNMREELNYNQSDEYGDIYLKGLGDFKAEFYFGIARNTTSQIEQFMYKYDGLETLETGMILYRNAFSISSLDGKKDWLDIASRARKSPAAATHRTGSWRVRLNQICGFVLIDKEENSILKDLANRQGLEEDEYYQVFKEVLGFGIGRFEKNRQTIIRKIEEKNKKDKLKQKKDENTLKSFLRKPSSIIKMSEPEISSLADEIKGVQREANEQRIASRESEQQHNYDVRILNVLATQGLRASAKAHELHNQRNTLELGYDSIIKALMEYGYWDILNSEDYTRLTYKNVPKLLSSLEEINKKLIAFLDVILEKNEKQKFNINIDSLEDTIEAIINIWKREYNWITFKVKIKSEYTEQHKVSKDVLEVIFDNLILNSVQHNEMKNELTIKIEIESVDKLLHLKYSDNGIGLKPKYKMEPKRILEVHETSRNDGHGLGMWIVNNTVNMYEGKILNIDGDEGFNIYFTIKG